MPNNSKKNGKKELKYFIGVIVFAIIICVIVFAIYAGIKLIVNPTDIIIVEQGTIAEEETQAGYVIRQETVIEGNGCDTIKNEGEKVAVGENIFRYYVENEENINSQITDLNIKIQEALAGQVNILQSDIKILETQISNKVSGINKKNNIQEISEDKKDINKYMSKISKIAGEDSQAGSYISNLIAQRTELENKLNNSSKYIQTSTSGVISYRIDGLENELTIDKISSLTSDYLENLNLKTGQIAATTTGICKIINNYECYIAVVSNSKNALNAKVGDKVSLRLLAQEEIPASIEQINNEGNKVVIFFKITDGVEKIISYRKVSIDVIWWSHSGLKVPNSALIFENGQSYIVRNKSRKFR